MNIFEELKKDLQVAEKEIKSGVQVGVTLDTGVRLAIFTAAKVLSLEDLQAIRSSLRECGILEQYPSDSEERKIAEKTFEDVMDGAEKLHQVLHPEK